MLQSCLGVREALAEGSGMFDSLWIRSKDADYMGPCMRQTCLSMAEKSWSAWLRIHSWLSEVRLQQTCL